VGEFFALKEHHVGPSSFGEVIEHAGTNHATADDHDTGTGLHSTRRSTVGVLSSVVEVVQNRSLLNRHGSNLVNLERSYGINPHNPVCKRIEPSADDRLRTASPIFAGVLVCCCAVALVAGSGKFVSPPPRTS
jgi:hypothetical protein